MTYTENDIRRHVSDNAFRAGLLYYQQHRVLSCEAGEEGRIRSRVQGNERRPYEQAIVIGRSSRGEVTIEGDCNCPVGFNCKHVAAALLEALTRDRVTVGPTGPGPDARAHHRPSPIVTPSASVLSAPSLPREIAVWLEDLERARASLSEDYPKEIAQRIVYVLAPFERGRAARLLVTAISARLLKDGRFSESGRPYDASNALSSAAPAKFLRPADLRIFRALTLVRREYGLCSETPLSGEGGWSILADILATGRARWLSVNGPVLAAGEARAGCIVWAPSGEAAMRPRLQIGDGLRQGPVSAVIVLNAVPPLYVDPAAGTIGLVETGYPPKLAAALLDAPAIPAEAIKAVGAAMARRLPEFAAMRPAEPGPPLVLDEPPVPVLKLFAAELPRAESGYQAYYGYQMPLERVGLARLSFRYGPVSVALGEPKGVVLRLHEGRLVEARRRLEAERRAHGLLISCGFAPAPERRSGVPGAHARDFLPEDDEFSWLDVLYHDLPRLKAEGWDIEIADDFPVRLLRGESAIEAEIREGSGIDWLELDLGVLIDGERIDLIGPIVALIQTPHFDGAAFGAGSEDDEPLYLPLADGRVLALPAARLAPLVVALLELTGGGEGEGRLRLTRADAASLAAFEDATISTGLVWRGGERIRAMGRKLSASSGIPPAVLPETFAATLRPYQTQGVAWLSLLRDVGLGGILADDMGLGKTVQALALVAIEKAQGRLDRPALVVAPTSLMGNWRREAEKFVPDLKLLTLHGADRKSRFDEIESSDLVLTTYPLIARDHATLAGQLWHLLLLDEAQTIKNPHAATTQLVRSLEARHRFCLTGTPLENHLGELWSLFAFASPGFLGDLAGFTRAWRTPIEKKGDVVRGRLLTKRVKPFLLRRTKEEVASELPAKTEIVERIEMQAAQRDLYEAIRLSMHTRVRAAIAEKGFARSRILILDALLKLRQACCDPRLVKLAAKAGLETVSPDKARAAKAGSAKLERLEEMLVELVDEGRRILVFSQFTSMLDLIRPRLDTAGVGYALLTGQTRDREAEIAHFQDGPVPVFLVSLKAGGTGLNLTAADTVILYDPWWNPAVEEQAIDRVHRIGQDKPVFVHKLVAVGTIEEKMEVLKEKKRALAESLFDHEGAPTLAMTEADLDLLFAVE